MLAWVPTVEPPGDRFVFERNPYFFAVDTEGNQLPYLSIGSISALSMARS